MIGSFIYSHASIYEAVMRALYGRGYHERFRPVAELIAEGSSVLDVCCGPGTLFHRYLKTKRVRYTGLDINRHFVERLSAAGGTGLIWNLEEARPLPRAEYVVMQASLYHFLPEASNVVDRLIAAAERQVLIAEPIRNLTDSEIYLLAFFARKLTQSGYARSTQPLQRSTTGCIDATVPSKRSRDTIEAKRRRPRKALYTRSGQARLIRAGRNRAAVFTSGGNTGMRLEPFRIEVGLGGHFNIDDAYQEEGRQGLVGTITKQKVVLPIPNDCDVIFGSGHVRDSSHQMGQ